MKKGVFLTAIAASAFIASAAQAGVVYGFGSSCTNNNGGDVAIGLAQLSFDVSANGSNVDFKFMNSGPAASSICDLYWDGTGTLASIFGITNGAGTSFGVNASPPNLPGGNNAAPPFSADFSADSTAPVQPNGVNPNEFVTITFALAGGKTFNDVINDLNSGALRVGIHVQGFATGGSEGFVNAVPAPSSLGLLGLAGLTAMRRRRR